MRFRSGVFPQRKINPLTHGWMRGRASKSEGSINWVAGLFMLLFLGILLYAQLQVELYRMSALYLEDALAASNLASAVVDIEEYGRTHCLQINDETLAFARYQTALRDNLGLDADYMANNRHLISGQVEILNYTIYNVKRQKVRSYSIDEKGMVSESEGTLGEVYAPNGQLVESTGVYSEIRYPVTGLWGTEHIARKGKLVDVVSEQEPIDEEPGENIEDFEEGGKS